MTRAWALVVAAGLAACGGDGGGAADAGSIDAPSGAIDASAGLPTSCEGPCAVVTLDADFDGTRRAFDRAVFGFTTGATTSLYLEAYAGGVAGCPSKASPEPDVTFIIGELPLPLVPGPVNTTSNLVDLEGALLPDVPTVAAATTVVGPVAFDGTSLVALEVAATFAGGTVNGHVFATHCPILDAAE